ncbi:MAG: NAD-dependent epimerase/dehydratase family protein [Phycisphaerales bacterium]|nr:MAG: NAD-dependent epimerase/dehydratase family protein [Phycisphaerales bacterium]
MPGGDLSQAYSGRTILVTGGAGFIGSHLTEALVNHGAEVCVLDDLSSGREENLQPVAGRIRFVRGSILDPAVMKEAAGGAELVFHLAALTSVPGSVDDPALYYEVNATGTLRVLEAARSCGTRRVVFSASSSAYGDAGGERKVETARPQPQSPYAVAKCAGEHLLAAYAHCYDLSTISLRYFNIFGPRQRPDSPYAAVLPRFAEALLQKRKPIIYGDGSQTRDFTHVANAVHANLLAGSCRKELRGEVVNIACGEAFSVLHLLRSIAEYLGVEPDCEFAPPRVGEILHSQASIEAARELIGFEPVMPFDRGLKDALDYYVRELKT